MHTFLLLVSTLLLSTLAYSQNGNDQNRFSLAVKYGVAYSFFVKYEQSPDQVPPGFKAFYNKNRIGSIGGIGFTYYLNDKNGIELTYDRQMHVGKKNFNGKVSDVNFTIHDFKLRHTNNFFGLNYRRGLFSANDLVFSVGAYILLPQQQEIDFLDKSILIEERNEKNSHLMEGGFFAGLGFMKKISGNFKGGLEAKVYYTASIGEFETVSLTPVLTYDF